MDSRRCGDDYHLSGDARQRFYDSSGYGRPLENGGLALAPVEAAHLLSRGDLDAVAGQSFRTLFSTEGDEFPRRFRVYADLRERGFYLSVARSEFLDIESDALTPESIEAADFVVYPRGSAPWDGELLYLLRVGGERDSVSTAELGSHVLAVVDEESEITYFEPETEPFEPTQNSNSGVESPVEGTLLEDRVLVWDYPESLYEQAFYGQPLEDAVDGLCPLQLSLLEAASLASSATLSLDGGNSLQAILEAGRTVEGLRFDRRLATYRALRERGLVPKTGFKFGADFRVYDPVDSIDNLGHAHRLVRVLEPEYEFSMQELALDVRMAHGVRKRMIYAAHDASGEQRHWRSISRLTP